MKRLSLSILTLFAAAAAAQNPPTPPPNKPTPQPKPESSADWSALEKKVENYLRKLYAWGPSFRLKVGPLRDAAVPGFYEVPVEVSMGAQSDSGIVYVSKDGRYLLRGDIQDMDTDSLAAVRSQIHLADNPSKGPGDARVTVVEYSDFQCPSCRQLHQTLRTIMPNYPHVRFVFKDFPLTQVHPWAMTAAIAGRCAYEQNHEAFWKLHDSIFDNQQVISPENVSQKTVDFAGQAGLDANAFTACMASPRANQAVMENVKEGQALKVANTPTVFVNGRRIVGGDRALLEQYIQYELATQPPSAPSKSDR